METTARSEDAVLLATARAAREVARLPGAPTPDWASRLARLLTDADPSTAAEVAIARLTPASPTLECRGDSVGTAAGASADPCRTDLRRLLLPVAASLVPSGRPGVWALAEHIDASNDSPRVRAAARRRPDAIAAMATLTPPTAGRAAILLWDAADASGFAPKDRRRMVRGLLPLISERLLAALGGSGERASWLSAREQRVLELLAVGLSVPEIAGRLGRSHHTIHDHVKRLHRKLGTSSRGALIARAPGPLDARRCSGAQHPMLAFRTDGRRAFVHHSGW